MPYDEKTRKFRAYTEDELKAIRPDWYPAPPAKMPGGFHLFPQLRDLGTTPPTAPMAPAISAPSAGPGPLVPQPQPSAPFKFPTQNQPFAQREFGAFPTSPEPFAQREFGSVPDTSANALAMVKALSANRMNPGLTIPKPPPTTTGQPSPLSQGVERFKQAAGRVDQAVDFATGNTYVAKIAFGKDLPKMTQEYGQYYKQAMQRGQKPLDPDDYFFKPGMYMSPSDSQRILIDSGVKQSVLSEGTKDFMDTVGGVVGQGAVLGPAGKLGSAAATKVMASPMLRRAPAWLQKTIGSIVGAGTTGATYQTGMDTLQEIAYPEEQTLSGHAKDVLHTSAYWSAYGVMGPAAEKVLEKAGGAIPQAARNAINRFPATKIISKSVAEGGLSGLGVGTLMFGKEMLKTGDAHKAWDTMTNESKQEMMENFAQTMLYAFMRRGPGKVTVPQRDVLDDVYDDVYSNLSSDMKGEFDTVLQHGRQQGYDDQTIKSVVMDYYSQSKDGEIALHKASEKLFAQKFENEVLQETAKAPAGQQQQTEPTAQDLMGQAAGQERGRVNEMLDALNGVRGQEAAARRQIDPTGVLEGFTAAPTPAAPVAETRPAPETGRMQGPKQPFAQAEHVRVDGQPGIFQVASDQEGKKRKLVGQDGKTIEVPPQTIRKFKSLQPGDQVTVSGREGIHTVDNLRDGKTIRLKDPNGSDVHLPASEIQPHFATSQAAAEPAQQNPNEHFTQEEIDALLKTAQQTPIQSGQQQAAPAAEAQLPEHMTDSIGGSEITLDANEQPVDTTGDPPQVWKKMREKLALSGALSAQFKVKHLTAMKDFAAQHGFEWAPRLQELMERFSEEVGINKQAKQDEQAAANEAAVKRAERQKQQEETTQKIRQRFLEDAKNHDTYDSFHKRNAGAPIPAEYRGSQSVDSYMRDVYAEAHGETPLSERNPLAGRVGETVKFEGPNGNELTGTITSIIDDQLVGVDVPRGDGKGTFPYKVHADEISSAAQPTLPYKPGEAVQTVDGGSTWIRAFFEGTSGDKLVVRIGKERREVAPSLVKSIPENPQYPVDTRFEAGDFVRSSSYQLHPDNDFAGYDYSTITKVQAVKPASGVHTHYTGSIWQDPKKSDFVLINDLPEDVKQALQHQFKMGTYDSRRIAHIYRESVMKAYKEGKPIPTPPSAEKAKDLFTAWEKVSAATWAKERPRQYNAFRDASWNYELGESNRRPTEVYMIPDSNNIQVNFIDVDTGKTGSFIVDKDGGIKQGAVEKTSKLIAKIPTFMRDQQPAAEQTAEAGEVSPTQGSQKQAKAQVTETVDNNISSRVVIQDGKVTVTSKAKNLDHELLPQGFDEETAQMLSYSFTLEDWNKAEKSHGNVHWARKKFIEEQINADAVREKLGHHPVVERIMDAQIRAITKAITRDLTSEQTADAAQPTNAAAPVQPKQYKAGQYVLYKMGNQEPAVYFVDSVINKGTPNELALLQEADPSLRSSKGTGSVVNTRDLLGVVPDPNKEPGIEDQRDLNIILWNGNERHVFTRSQQLYEYLHRLNEAQLRAIADEYKITGVKGMAPALLQTFITDALTRDQFGLNRKALKDIAGQSMQKIKDTVPASVSARIERMVKKFKDGTVDYRIDQVLFQPIIDGKGFTAINYTDLKTDEQHAIVLDADGKEIEKFTGYAMKRDYPNTLAEWTWDNYSRDMLPVGETDWTGWTQKDRTRARQAAKLRQQLADAKWTRNKPEMHGNENDPDFAGPGETQAQEPAKQQGFTYHGNRVEVEESTNRILIYFKEKPAAEIREVMKAQQMRWHGKNEYWYGNSTPERMAFSERIVRQAHAISSLTAKQKAEMIETDRRLDRGEVPNDYMPQGFFIDENGSVLLRRSKPEGTMTSWRRLNPDGTLSDDGPKYKDVDEEKAIHIHYDSKVLTEVSEPKSQTQKFNVGDEVNIIESDDMAGEWMKEMARNNHPFEIIKANDDGTYNVKEHGGNQIKNVHVRAVERHVGDIVHLKNQSPALAGTITAIDGDTATIERMGEETTEPLSDLRTPMDSNIDFTPKQPKPEKPASERDELDEMSSAELQEEAQRLRVPSWGSKEQIAKRIRKAYRAREALGDLTAEELKAFTVDELEKIMLDADMLPTESNQPRNKDNHIRRLLEWRDGRGGAEQPASPDYDDPIMGAYYFADKLPKPDAVYQNRTYSHGLHAFSEWGALTQQSVKMDLNKTLKKIDYMLENPTHMISASDEQQPIGNVGVFTKGDVHAVSTEDIDSVRPDKRNIKGHDGKRLIHHMNVKGLLTNAGEHYEKFQRKVKELNEKFDNRAGERNDGYIEAILSPTSIEGIWYRQDSLTADELAKLQQHAKDNNLPVWEIANQKEFKRTLVTTEQQQTPAQAAPQGDARAQQIADELKKLIRAGTEIKSGDLYRIADNVYRGSQAKGTYSPKDAYDALELAVNQYLLEQKDIDLTTRDAETVKANVEKLSALMTKLPTQTKRTEEQERFQQFSTPPVIAYVASWVADITDADTVLEPSAGIGGIAVFAKANGAQVVVNELDPRRLDVLRNMPFDQYFKEDAEQINNILPKDVRPTVVLMNPPFSTSATRGITSTKNSFNHVDQALKRLEPGGRLVAVLGLGRAEGNSKGFIEWIDKLKNRGNAVRAIIGVDGKNYAKYGTTFNVQIVVIDKGSAETETIKAYVDTLDKAVDLLGGIANERQQMAAGNRTDEQNAVEPAGTANSGQSSTTRPNGSNSGRRDSSGSASQVGDAGRGNQDQVGESGNTVRPADEVREPADTTANDERTNDLGSTTDDNTGNATGDTEGSSSEHTGSLGEQEDRPGYHSNNERVKPKKSAEMSDAIFEDYVPQKLNITDTKKHPGQLAESAAMSAIELPDLHYKVQLPKHIVTSGTLSDAQLEAVAYAGQAHSQILPDGVTRKGFFLGDGTGVGKGREISGIILDNFNQGRTKAVWVSMNDGLLGDSRAYWEALGGDSEEVFKKPKLGDPIKQQSGILYTTYSTLGKGHTGDNNVTPGGPPRKQSRLDQLVEWLGPKFDGVIVFDEAHNMANAVDMKGARGIKKASQAALAGVDLQQRLPNARIVYASATGATEVSNLSYAERLGLWGTGTAFASKFDFINKINAGGIAAMELVARDMKAMGVYIARNLSYNGVEYQKLVHNLTAPQTEIYDTLAHSWQIVLQNINAALEVIGAVSEGGKTLSGTAKRNAIGQFWGAQQRFFNQVLTAMQMPRVISEAEKDLAAGKAIVMQLVNTNEASQERGIAKLEEEEGELEDLDLTPRDILLQFIDKSFPVIQHEEYVDDNGNIRSRPVQDSQGNYVINVEAQAMKDELMARLSSVKVPEGPLEIVLNHFGVENVAEITGRSQRVVQRQNEDTGRTERVLEKRSFHSKESDVDAFMQGKKNILVFSNAGGTGRSYHADNTKPNKKQRMHYLIQAGWEATKAVQGFGRSHRTNQASTPVYKLFTTNLKGQMRFVSSIARRLDQLGALTKGQRQTGSQGMFSAADNLESNIAVRALVQFYSTLAHDQISYLNKRDILGKMGLEEKILDSFGNFNANAEELTEVTKFLNRILTLESGLQNEVFDAFMGIVENMTRVALQDGTLDTGLENLKADSVTIKEQQDIRKDEATGSVTKYYQIDTGKKTVPMKLQNQMKGQDYVGTFQNKQSKAVRALHESGNSTLASGAVVKRYFMQGPEQSDYKYINEEELGRSKWEKLPTQEEVQEELDDTILALQAGGMGRTEAIREAKEHIPTAEHVWQKALDELPDMKHDTVHMISGTLLPVWDRLPTDRVRVVRALTDDKQMLLGRIIPENAIDATLHRLGAEKRAQQIDTTNLAEKILDGWTVHLANGWKLMRRKISGEWRIEVDGDTLWKYGAELRTAGVFTEKIAYDTRYFVPTGQEGNAVINEIIKHRPVAEIVPPADSGRQSQRGNDGSSALASAAPPQGGTTGGPKKRKKKAAPTVQDQIERLQDTTRMLTPKTARAIADVLADELDTLIYQGRVRPGAEGIYNQLRTKAIAVRERSADSWRVVGHELGHAFSKEQQRIGDKQELIDLMNGLYPNPAKVGKKQREEEGFAEFFRLWVADPVLAEQYAPKTTADFETYIANDPILEPVFAKIRLLVDNDFADNATGRVVAGVISSEYRNNDEDADDSGTQGPKFQLGKLERKLFKVADFTIPAKHLDAALEKAAKRPDVSLRRLLSIMGDSRAKALLTFSSVPQDHKGYKLSGAILQDLYEEGIQHVIDFMGDGTVNLNSREIRENVAKRKYAKALYKKYRKMGAKDAFDALLLALRVKERYDTGKHTDGSLPITRAHAEEVIAHAETNYPDAIDAAERLTTRFSEINLKLLVNADVITQETADRVKDGSSWYIPFYYVDDKRPIISASKFGGRSYGQPVKPFRGQVKPTIDAFQAMMMKLMEVHQAIEYKRVMSLLHEIGKTEESKHFMRLVPQKIDVIKIQSDDVADQIFEHTGIDLSGALQNIQQFKFYSPHKGLDPNRRTILNYQSVKDPKTGKVTQKAVEIELAKDLFDSIMAMKPVQVNAIGQFMRRLTRVQRFTGLVTLRYLFSTVMLRDPGAVLMQSEKPMQNFKHFMNGLTASLGIGEEGNALYETFVHSGAASGAMENMLRNIGKIHFGDDILHIKASGWGYVKIGGKKVLTKVVQSPGEALRLLEEGPRISEFLATWKREVSKLGHNGDQLWKDYAKDGADALPRDVQAHIERILVDSAYAAREVTTNFGLHGESETIRKYIPTVPFLQGSVQGFYRFTRQLKAQPVKTLAVSTTSFGLMSLLSYALMKGLIPLLGDDDDDKKRRAQDYNDLDSTMKDKYWWFPVAPGVYLSMAKPFEYAIPANILERILDQTGIAEKITGKPNLANTHSRKWYSDMKSLLGTMTNVDVINNMVHVFMDLNANRNSFGGAIVPQAQKKLAKDMQFGPETSMTARNLATFITDHFGIKAGPAPREMDYAVRGLLGRYGTGALNLTDVAFALAHGQNIPGAVATTKPIGGASHMPVLGQILYDRSELGGSRQVDKFYRDLDFANRYGGSAVQLIKQENAKLPGWATTKGIEVLRAKPMLEAVDAMLGDMNDAYKTVINDVKSTPSQRESYRLQQNYLRELLTGIPYGIEPTPPAEITKITPAMVDQLTAGVIAEINEKVQNEAARKGGPSEQWEYFMWLTNQQ